MGRLFGTDGIRGVANVDLTPALAFALGRATARRLAGPGTAIVVGRDTRRSGDMFVSAIAAGAASLGADVHLAGEVPTPGLAFLVADGGYAAGVMVSASHNPADDNGIKQFGHAMASLLARTGFSSASRNAMPAAMRKMTASKAKTSSKAGQLAARSAQSSR